MPAHFYTNRLVRYAILAWHLWHVVVFPAVKSVCLLGLPAKNVPPCKHMCHIPSPYILSRGSGSPIPHAWSFASHYPLENKHCAWWKCVCCTRLISVTKSITSESKLHIVVCVNGQRYLCQWGLKHLLRHWLQCPTTAQRGVIRVVEDGYAGCRFLLQPRPRLRFTFCLLPGYVLCLFAAWTLTFKTVCPTARQHYAYKHRHVGNQT